MILDKTVTSTFPPDKIQTTLPRWFGIFLLMTAATLVAAAPSADDFAALQQQHHRPRDLFFFHHDDVVDKLFRETIGQIARSLDGNSVGDGRLCFHRCGMA